MITEEQLKIRKKGIGGSDAAKVCGMSKFGTPFDVWNSKVNDVDQVSNKSMKFGSEMEPYIIKKYEEITGNTVKIDNQTLFCKKNKFMLANIDGIVTDKNIIVEAKTSHIRSEWGEDNTCDVPIDYLCQIAHYCAVYNAPEAHIIVMFNGSKYGLYKYIRNQNLENAIINKEKSFWEENIIKNVSPPVTSLKSAKIMYSKASDDKVVSICDDETFKNFQDLKYIYDLRKKLDSDEEKIKTDIFLKMGVSSEIHNNIGDKLATWNNIESNRFDLESFKKDNIDLYNQYLKKSLSRRFVPNFKHIL